MLMALDLPLSKRLLVHSHWTVEKRKMSKSLGNVVNPFETMKTYGTDAARYFLAKVGGRFKYDVGMCLPITHHSTALTRFPPCRNRRLVRERVQKAQCGVDVTCRKLLHQSFCQEDGSTSPLITYPDHP